MAVKESELTPEKLEELGVTLEKIVAGEEKRQETADEQAEQIAKIQAETTVIGDNMEAHTAKLSTEIAAVKDRLGKTYGESGADDWCHDMSKFISAAYFMDKIQKGKCRAVPDWCKNIAGQDVEELVDPNSERNKAAADFTVATDATMGYLVPDLMRPGLIGLKDLFGTIYPKLSKFVMPAGHTMKINRKSAGTTAYWRGTELSGITEEGTPFTAAQDTITTELLGTYMQISNELLNSPGVGFGALATTELVKGIMDKLETDVIGGTTGAGAPSDGIAVDAVDQGNIATATFANIVVFLQACVADDPSAINPLKMSMVLTPTDILALASEAVGASELTGMLVWGDPRRGIPTTLLGYEIFAHSVMTLSTVRYILLCDFSGTYLGEDASFSIDMNPFVEGAYLENASILRVFNHYDWSIGQPTEAHTTTVADS